MIPSKTHAEWYKFLDATPERFLTNEHAPTSLFNIPRSRSTVLRRGTLDSCETAYSGIGADFAQRPTMALRWCQYAHRWQHFWSPNNSWLLFSFYFIIIQDHNTEAMMASSIQHYSIRHHGNRMAIVQPISKHTYPVIRPCSTQAQNTGSSS